MIETARSPGPIVSAPHHLAAGAGLAILRAGGNAAEALVATLAVLAVVYPHMTGLGGDGFFLLRPPPDRMTVDGAPIAIDGAGRAGRNVTAAFYRERGFDAVPLRGPLAINTVPGAVGSWQAALEAARDWGRKPLPLDAVLEPAIGYARDGAPLARALAEDAARLGPALGAEPGFREAYRETRPGVLVRRERLGRTLALLARDGLDGFYRGALARAIASDLAAVGAPIDATDLAGGGAHRVHPLRTVGPGGALCWNLPPPTQGVVSLGLLGLFSRLPWAVADGPGGLAHVHALLEAMRALQPLRDALPGDNPAAAARALDPTWLDRLTAGIDRDQVLSVPPGTGPRDGGDTVWCGAIDADGGVASAINSLYHEFGAGVVLPETGITAQNRGTAFTLDDGPRGLAPGRAPFHTLNPALAELPDGRVVAYGSMGGDGQPQFGAAILTRYAVFGETAQRAVTAPRWLLGRTWDDAPATVRIERNAGDDLIAALRRAGHDVTVVPPLAPIMGHAGMVVLRPDGVREGAADPRSDGLVAAC